MLEYNALDRNKLNPEFSARLNQLAPHQKVRAIREHPNDANSTND